MKIIQRGCLKIVVLTIILHLSASPLADAQIYRFRLQTADSLFQAKRYTQSLEHYEEILSQQYYTPAMLLKMAYIYEGLNQMGSAMYCLNLYYLATNDEAVLTKMDEIARKFNLEGYETTDADRFWSFYLENHLWISFSLAALVILVISIMFHTRTRLHKRPIGSAIAAVLLCAILFLHQHYGSVRSQAIIASATTYLMDGPSAGASVVNIVGDGHRVQVLGKKDVWLKIRWDDEVAYVKQHAVKQLKL